MHTQVRMLFAAIGLAAVFSTPGHAVTIDWVSIGDPGNACDPNASGCLGSVSYSYRISRYEVTNGEYAEFLNAVAQSDEAGLYNISMGSGFGGIARGGAAGSYVYSVIAGRGSRPVNHVSFYDALRFANWMHNGQPTGALGLAATEDGAYTLTPDVVASHTVSRNASAAIFLPSEDEQFKAAYYDPATASYFDYPMSSNSFPSCAAPSAALNIANCFYSTGNLTDVGSYSNAASPYGTFDQGGNVWEFSDSVLGGRLRVHGGSIGAGELSMAAFILGALFPTNEDFAIGFRIAALEPIPEPGTAILVVAGLTGLAMDRRRWR